MLFQKKLPRVSTRSIDELVSHIRVMINDNGNINKHVANTAISTEGYGEQEAAELNDAVLNVQTGIEQICSEMNYLRPNNIRAQDVSLEDYENFMSANSSRFITDAQIEAGTAAGILAGNIPGFLGSNPRSARAYNELERVSTYQPFDGTMQRSSIFNVNLSQEHFNEHSLKEAAIFSIAYNMQAARQDDFCETFFPTLVITPDQVGFGMIVSLIGVFDDFKHKITGDRAEMIRKNIIHAVVDPTILKNELTRLVPVFRKSENEDKFTSDTDITPRTIDLEGISILTQPYKPNTEVNVLGLCSHDDLIAAGLMDVSDTIDTGVTLENIYFKFGDDIVRFNTSTLHSCNFTERPQGTSMTMQLSFETTSLLLNKNSVQNDGSALVSLASIVSGDYRFRISAKLNGTLQLDRGLMELSPGSIRVYSIRDTNNEIVPKTESAVSAAVKAIESGSLIGYDIRAFRMNNNRRTRGQLITTWDFTQKYNITLKSPITALTPINANNNQYNTNDLNALITATRIRASNAGVAKLIDTASRLSEYIDVRDQENEAAEIYGMGVFFVRPAYFFEDLDVNDCIDSIKSHERSADIQAVLVNKIRDYVYKMYQKSEYKAAADVLSGGVGQLPTIIIGTDPVISRYLQISGDLRIIGNDFPCKVVSTLDERIIGKIFITFGVFDEHRNTSPNVLNFGNFLYSPEVTIQVPITRNGAVVNELAVQPRFDHVCHLPIMTVLQISGITESLNKVPMQVFNSNTQAVVHITYTKTNDTSFNASKVYYEKVGSSYLALSAAAARAKFQAAGAGNKPNDVYEAN